MSLFEELRRRRVFRALIGYGIVSFAVLQVVEPVMHGLHLPEVTLTFAIVGLAAGFPLVVVLAWAFDVKASGIERTAPAQGGGLRGARLSLLLVGVGALAAAPGVLWYFVVRGPAKQHATASAPSIAVLPLVNMSSDPANEYLSDGISEELIDVLTQLEGLRVASRTSAFAFKGKPVDVAEIGAKLKVATVLEGSVRRDGPRVRLTAQLVDTGTGYHLWSQTYEREMKDVFAVEHELARSIAATLRPRLFPSGSQGKAPTQSVEAHDLYLRGRHFWNQRTKAGLTRALSLFEEAIARDPRYVLAHVGVADSSALLIDYAAASRAEMLPKARAAATRALELDGDSAEAHATLGLIRMYERDWRGAEQEYRRAIDLNPRYPSAHQWYASLLAMTGRIAESRSHATAGLQLDPLSVPVNLAMGFVYYDERNYAAAAAQASQAVELDPGAPGPHLLLALAHLQQGRKAEALAEIEVLDKLVPGAYSGVAGIIYVANGKREKALQLRDELEEPGRPFQAHKRFRRAMIDMALGDLDAAITGFELAFAEGGLPLINFKMDPIFDPLRRDPRFAMLLKKLNLE